MQENHSTTGVRKETIIEMLKDHGCRITKQRQVLLDIILEEDCCCCKEICYRARKRDPEIGTATVYRMINTLEDMGVISRSIVVSPCFCK